MERSRFIVGLILIAVAVLIFLFTEEGYSTSGAIVFLVLGLTMVAISRRRSNRKM